MREAAPNAVEERGRGEPRSVATSQLTPELQRVFWPDLHQVSGPYQHAHDWTFVCCARYVVVVRPGTP